MLLQYILINIVYKLCKYLVFSCYNAFVWEWINELSSWGGKEPSRQGVQSKVGYPNNVSCSSSTFFTKKYHIRHPTATNKKV